MINEITNELNESRVARLQRYPDATITRLVLKAVELKDGSAAQALQGIDAAHDGITRSLWDQAITSADVSGVLVFPQFRHAVELPFNAEPCLFEEAEAYVAERVALAILVVNGFKG